MHTNQRLLAEELIRRGARVRVVDEAIELLEVSFNGTTEYLLDRASKAVSYLSSSLAADKHLTKHVLRQKGLCVPDGGLFDSSQLSAALEYGASLGFPLAVKPNVGSHGDGVRSGIANLDQLESAICSMLILNAGSKGHFIVERHIHGDEFRIFVTTQGAYAVLLREPAYVMGDGIRSIRALAQSETERRQTVKALEGSSLCPIALDHAARGFLRSKGLDFDSIPASGDKVQLRLSSNLAQGGVSTDMTDQVHPSAIALAKRALEAFEGLPCLGVDFITRDIAAPQSDGASYAIIEVNANPGISMHHMPTWGQPRDVAKYLADVMFPSLQTQRRPQ